LTQNFTFGMHLLYCCNPVIWPQHFNKRLFVHSKTPFRMHKFPFPPDTTDRCILTVYVRMWVKR